MNKTYPYNLNPKTIKVLEVVDTNNDEITFRVVEKQSNILHFIYPELIYLFGEDDVMDAILNTDVVYHDLISYVEIPLLSSNKMYRFKNNILDVVRIANKDIYDRKEANFKTQYSLLYHTYHFNKYGKLIQHILNKNYAFLNKPMYNKVITQTFDTNEMLSGVCSYISNIPKPIRSLTLNEIFNNPKNEIIEYSELTPKLKIYYNNNSDCEMFYRVTLAMKDYNDKDGLDISLHLNLKEFLSGDWDSIRENTIKYFHSYYGRICRLDVDKIIELFFSHPEILELEKDIKSIKR